MIWTKGRNGGSGYWGVYHKGLNGGTNPWNYRLLLNDTHPESDGGGSYTTWYWNDTAPTATHFSVGEISNSNANNTNFVAMLFASANDADGNPISKVGSYTGNGSATSRTITTGFQPRFLVLKNTQGYNNWFVLDTLRGWVSGIDQTLSFNSTNPNYGGENVGHPVSTGFTLNNALANFNENGTTYIYYAHA